MLASPSVARGPADVLAHAEMVSLRVAIARQIATSRLSVAQGETGKLVAAAVAASASALLARSPSASPSASPPSANKTANKRKRGTPQRTPASSPLDAAAPSPPAAKTTQDAAAQTSSPEEAAKETIRDEWQRLYALAMKHGGKLDIGRTRHDAIAVLQDEARVARAAAKNAREALETFTRERREHRERGVVDRERFERASSSDSLVFDLFPYPFKWSPPEVSADATLAALEEAATRAESDANAGDAALRCLVEAINHEARAELELTWRAECARQKDIAARVIREIQCFGMPVTGLSAKLVGAATPPAPPVNVEIDDAEDDDDDDDGADAAEKRDWQNEDTQPEDDAEKSPAPRPEGNGASATDAPELARSDTDADAEESDEDDDVPIAKLLMKTDPRPTRRCVVDATPRRAASEPPPLMCETCGAGPFKKQHGLNLHKTRWCVKEKDADETRAREEAPPPPPVKRGRGRPKGSKNKNKFLGELD